MELELIENTSPISRELHLAEKANQLEMTKTLMRKHQFINQVKSGLGNEIKANPNKVIFIKKPFKTKIKEFLLNLFTKF